MAETDWTYLNDGLDAAATVRGVTTGILRPPGGGSFVFGFNSLSAAQGAVALCTNQANFAPMAKGGSIRAALQRGPSGGPLGFAPFLYLGLQGPSVNDLGYQLGLADGDPHHIVLRKGSLVTGLPDASPGTLGVLARSTATFVVGAWVHLRLDMVSNQNGDVLLQVWSNDLAAHPIGTAPSWAAVPGLDQVIDDALGINTGSSPFTSGRAGFGFWSKDITRRAFVDDVEIYRQLG